MTVGIAWIRKTGRADQLWVASDSRLSGDGNVWDECPKLLTMPRRDAVAAFSGSTAQAYPLMLQMGNAILGHSPALDGALELNNLFDHLEGVANSMLERLQPDPAVRGTRPGREFASFDDMVLIGGFSRQNGLVLRTLRYERSLDRWKFARVRSGTRVGPNKPFHVFGDRIASRQFHVVFESLLRRKRKLRTEKPFDFEPLEALWDFVKLPQSAGAPLAVGSRPPSVGGAVQAVRILAGARATPCVVRWGEAGASNLYLLGRRLLANENLQLPLIEETGGSPRLVMRAPGQWEA